MPAIEEPAMEYTFNKVEQDAIDSFKVFCEWYRDEIRDTYGVDDGLEHLDWTALSVGFFLRELGATNFLTEDSVRVAQVLATHVRYVEHYWM